MKRTARAGLVLAISLALFGAGGIGLFRSTGPSSQGTSPVAAPGPPLSMEASEAGSLDRVVQSLQNSLRTSPDANGFASLGLAYVQQARLTADPAFYPRAEAALRRSLALGGESNFDAFVGMGALDLARHDFSSALEWGKRARALNPYNGGVQGLIGDALLELGRYEDAFRAFQRMVNLRPDMASYARVSYARELQGDLPGAIRAMKLALESASTREDAAWAGHQLGELYWGIGDLNRAASWYRRGVEMAPSFVPPHAGLAKVAYARGRTAKAIHTYRWVAERYPSPEYLIALGDIFRASGRPELARQQYELVRAEAELFRAGGVNVDLELALFDADHGGEKAALTTARAEWIRRHSVHVADALAWAFYRNQRFEEADRYARRALRLGTKNSQFLYHAGMIRLALGDERAARSLLRRALGLNPGFSILSARIAERTLTGLGRTP
ncbi:MAG: tetratricopeptide repeat protein [Actinomycetota bacterium]